MELTLGEIITFYSYKGGTGRSMALANTAYLLVQKQKTSNGVLMIDWDLEAPGLHQFFHGRFENTRDGQGDLPSGQLGLIDLFYEIRNRLDKSKPQDNISEDIFSEIDIQKYIVKVNHPSLFLMPAGKFDDGLYSAGVNEFDWSDFFSNFPLVITQFAQYLRKKFKYVLIDSRTGYTDISGICTSIMPEKLVIVFTPNRQSLSGVVEMIRRATDYRKQSDDPRPLMIFPLPSRIENAESKLQEEWRFGNSEYEGYQVQLASVLMDVYDLQKCDLTDYFDEYQLQYVPRYSYGEELSVLSERPEDRLSLARSFENFAERITSSEMPWEVTKELLSRDGKEHKGNNIEVRQPESGRKKFLRATASVLGIVGIFIMFFVVSSLLNGGNNYFPGVSTPSPSATAICPPNVQLSTPEGFDTSSRLFVILYDPRYTGDQFLELKNGEETQDIPNFIRKIIPSIIGPGDGVVVFQLGYSTYDDAIVTRLNSFITIPQLYNTPPPLGTFTPLPTANISTPGFAAIATSNSVRVQSTARASTEQANQAFYDCEVGFWNSVVQLTATAWKVTQAAEVVDIISKTNRDFENFGKNVTKTPFSTSELDLGGAYYGLNFATTVFQDECRKYSDCVIILIDDLSVLGKNNPDKLPIDLSGVSIYSILQNCIDINQPSCMELRNYWDNEFVQFGAKNIIYMNGTRVELNLLDALRR